MKSEKELIDCLAALFRDKEDGKNPYWWIWAKTFKQDTENTMVYIIHIRQDREIESKTRN